MNPLLAAALVSSLQAMPKVPAVDKDLAPVGVAIKDIGTRATWHEMSTRGGTCIAPSWGRLTNEYSSAVDEKDEKPSYLERLVQKDGKTTLERQRFTFAPKEGTLAVSPRVSVALQEVARAEGVVVWAFRDGKDVVLVSRAFDGGYESAHKSPEEEGGFSFIGADGCPFAEARLDATAAKTGAAAELHGQLPKRGKGKDAVTPTFTVYASLSRLSRDPEPTLAVRVRVKE